MSEIQPVRLQRSRRRGVRLVSPNGLPVVVVSRGTKWGNPYVARDNSVAARQEVVEAYEMNLDPATMAAVRRELRGRNLACWCALPELGQPDVCHAAVLLKIANEVQS